jgi:phospholipid/cholesterol/gamma-HCH transport system substrate-binding protein
MQQMSMEVTVGAFMFMVLMALGVFTIILSRENIFTRKYYVEAVFEDVMELRAGDRVSMRGLEIGKVSRLWLEPDGVHVVASSDRPLNLREDYRASILASTVLGGRYLEIYEGSTDRPPLPPDTILKGDRPIDIIEEATEVVEDIRSVLVGGGVLDNLQATMQELRNMAENVNQGNGTIGKLITDDTLYEEATSLAAGIRKIVDQVEQGEGTLAMLLNDDSLYTELAASASNLNVITARLESGEGTLGKLLSEDDTLYADLQETLGALKEISVRLRDGEGTIGRLVADETLYDEVRLLVYEVRAAVDDFRETAPITLFSSIFFGAF